MSLASTSFGRGCGLGSAYNELCYWRPGVLCASSARIGFSDRRGCLWPRGFADLCRRPRRARRPSHRRPRYWWYFRTDGRQILERRGVADRGHVVDGWYAAYRRHAAYWGHTAHRRHAAYWRHSDGWKADRRFRRSRRFCRHRWHVRWLRGHWRARASLWKWPVRVHRERHHLSPGLRDLRRWSLRQQRVHDLFPGLSGVWGRPVQPARSWLVLRLHPHRLR
jgi:hypothetical protein